MAVKIRLSRVGRKNLPLWRVAVFDSRTRRDGRYLDNLGIYNPGETKPENKIKIDRERYDQWLKRGARPTETVERLLKHAGILPK
ncbi:MAG: 30S ribosomal protein S16 [Planctomycetes bacterium]|nr:30S ribosomal protein S16 [Planctomycetota bacterium]